MPDDTPPLAPSVQALSGRLIMYVEDDLARVEEHIAEARRMVQTYGAAKIS